MKDSKNKAFILISVVFLITFLLGNLLIGYLIVIRKGQRLESILSNFSYETDVHNLEILAYDELRRIDKAISTGQVKDGSEYIASHSKFGKVWLGNSQDSYSTNRYHLNRMRYDNKTFYLYSENEEKVNFQQIMEMELRAVYSHDAVITIEMKKTFVNSVDRRKITLLAKIDLEYHSGNKNPSKPDSEKFKEIVINFER